MLQQSSWSILLQTVSGASRSVSHGRGVTLPALVSCLLLLMAGFCAAHQDPPKHLRVSVQYIEVAPPVLTEMLAGKKQGGPALHAKAIALTKEGKAKILETCMVVCRSGQKATIESIREVIYPTDWEFEHADRVGAVQPIQSPPSLRPNEFSAFETRKAGVTFEIEPTLSENGHFIDLRFVPEIVSLIGHNTWMEHNDPWGAASLRMPVFETWRVNTSVTLMVGQSEMVAIITPKSAVPAVSRKLLVFVRADVITL